MRERKREGKGRETGIMQAKAIPRRRNLKESALSVLRNVTLLQFVIT